MSKMNDYLRITFFFFIVAFVFHVTRRAPKFNLVLVNNCCIFVLIVET